MKQYETMVILDAMLSDDVIASEVQSFAEKITAAGEILRRDDWGKRKLAFEVNGLTDGDYTLVNFHADPQNVAELDRVLRINDAVVRHMIVRHQRPLLRDRV